MKLERLNMDHWSTALVLLLTLSYRVVGQQTLSEEDQEEILNAHNYYRSLVDPIAINMLKMVLLFTLSAITIAYNGILLDNPNKLF